MTGNRPINIPHTRKHTCPTETFRRCTTLRANENYSPTPKKNTDFPTFIDTQKGHLSMALP